MRSASVKLRLWPTHVTVLSGQEIQMLSKGLIEESFAFFIRSSAFLAIMCLDNHVSMSMCLGAILLHADLLWLVPDQSCGQDVGQSV